MDAYNVVPLVKLIEQFERLPGIGHKSAQRLAFHVLNMKKEDALRDDLFLLLYFITYFLNNQYLYSFLTF